MTLAKQEKAEHVFGTSTERAVLRYEPEALLGGSVKPMGHHLYLPDTTKPRHLQLKRLILAIRDMKLAATALKSAINLSEKDPVRSALTSAAIVYYARSFASGRNWGSISAKWAKFDSPELTELHSFIERWRNSVVAHNDDELNDVEFIPKGSYMDFTPEGKGKPVRLTIAKHTEMMRAPTFPSKLLEPFMNLGVMQATRMGAAADSERNILFSEFIKPSAKKSP